MKNNFIRAAVFTLLLGVLLTAAHLSLLRGLRLATSAPFVALNKIVNGRINSDILIIGSSRAHVHYDSNIIRSATNRSCFNIGMDGVPLDSHLTLFRTYLSHNRAPDVLLINLDLGSFSISKEICDPYQYVPYLDEKFIYEWLLKKDLSFW